MVDDSKKIDFEDFLKIYPPLSPKIDKSNYKTFDKYFKKKDKKEEKTNEQKTDEEKNNLEIKNKQKNNNIIIIDENENIDNNKNESKEDEWYLVNKGIDLQNKKRKRTNDIKQALEIFFNNSDLISKLSKYFHEFQSELITPSESSQKNINTAKLIKKENKNDTTTHLLRLPSFIKDKEIEEKILDKIKGITNKLTESVKMLKLEENKFIIRMFEIGEQCYFLLSGRLSVLKPVEYKNIKITYEDYFRYLMTLYHSKEYDLIEQLIEINRRYVNMHNFDNFLIFIKAYFIVKLNNDIKNEEEEINIKYIDKKLENFYLTYEDYYLRRDEIKYQISQIKYNSSPKKTKLNSQIKDYLLSVFRPSVDDTFIMKQYNFLFDKKNEKESQGCSLFKYEIFICLFPGAFFGETALENSSHKRNASIRTEEDCIILSLNNDTYRNLLSNDSKRLKSLDIAFLCNNFFFRNLSPVLFDKYYFPFFKALLRQKDDILFRQGDEMKNVFLLKEGQVKFEIFCSVFDLYNIIKNYIYVIEKNNNLFKLNEKNIKNLKETYLKDSFYFNLRNKSEDYNEEIKKKRKMFVFIYNTYDCIGLIENFLNSNYIMSCYVNSLSAKLHEISRYNLEKIITGEKQIVNHYYQSVCNKLISQIKRLNNIKIDNIKQIEYKLKEKFYDETKNMKYFIRGQVGITKPYMKERIQIKEKLYDDEIDGYQSKSSNKFDNYGNNFTKEMFHAKTESDNIALIINKKNNKYKKRYSLIGKTNNINNKDNNNKGDALNNIKNLNFKIKEDKKMPFLTSNKFNRYSNSISKLNNITKNKISNTIINCGRKFLSLRQIKNKLRYIANEYSYKRLLTEDNNSKNINNNNNVNNLTSFYKNEFGLSQTNLRYDLLNARDRIRIPNNITTYFSGDSFGKNIKILRNNNTSITSSNRSTFWKNKQIQNVDKLKKLNPNKNIINTVFVESFGKKRKEINNLRNNNILEDNISLLINKKKLFKDC